MEQSESVSWHQRVLLDACGESCWNARLLGSTVGLNWGVGKWRCGSVTSSCCRTFMIEKSAVVGQHHGRILQIEEITVAHDAVATHLVPRQRLG
eukprot:2937375-Amphidinium_carterae.1